MGPVISLAQRNAGLVCIADEDDVQLGEEFLAVEDSADQTNIVLLDILGCAT